MRKSLVTIVTIAFFLLLTSAYSTTPADSRVGYQAPNTSLSNRYASLSTGALKGEYVLITFWSTANPESRISNMRYDRLCKAAQGRIRHLSVNLDRSGGVCAMASRLDGIQPVNVFHFASGEERNRLEEQWRLDGGDSCKSFLIDPSGKILAADPQPSQLQNI